MLGIGGKLALICLIAGITLGLVNAVTAPKIANVKAQTLARALAKVSGGKEVGAETVEDDHPVVRGYFLLSSGYILNLIGVGYGGDLELLVSYSLKGEIEAVALMDNLETPGLGKNAEKPEYMEKYLGAGAARPVPVTKQQLSQSQADSVSGATITFVGIGQALADGAIYAQELSNAGP